MKNIEDIGNKTFQNEGLVNKRTRCVSNLSMMIYVGREEGLEMPMLYCLCRGMEPKPSTLETKHCLEKGCPYLVFVKEVWTAPQKEVINLG